MQDRNEPTAHWAARAHFRWRNDWRDAEVRCAAVLSVLSGVCLACLPSLARAQAGTDAAPGTAPGDSAAVSQMRGIAEGQPVGIEVGSYAPDFELEPVAVHDDFKRWLGDKAPKTFQDKIMLSDLAHKAPIVLLFGSYT